MVTSRNFATRPTPRDNAANLDSEGTAAASDEPRAEDSGVAGGDRVLRSVAGAAFVPLANMRLRKAADSATGPAAIPVEDSQRLLESISERSIAWLRAPMRRVVQSIISDDELMLDFVVVVQRRSVDGGVYSVPRAPLAATSRPRRASSRLAPSPSSTSSSAP